MVVFSHNRLTGVTTFNWTLSKILSRENYEVHVHIVFRETKLTLIEDNLKLNYPTTVGKNWPKEKFDLVFFSDRKSLNLGQVIKAKRFFIAHGLGEPAQELQPIDLHLVDHLFSLSPFMNFHYSKLYPLLSQSFLPNFIDTDRFNCDWKLNSHPKMVLLNDRRKGKDYFLKLAPVFKELNIELLPVADLNFGYPIWEMEKTYPSFDIVLGYGRSIYEAMSCGRNVIAIGPNGADGFLTEENFKASFYKNASGWGIQKFKLDELDFSKKLQAEISQYSDKKAAGLRQLAVDFLGIEKNKKLLMDSI